MWGVPFRHGGFRKARSTVEINSWTGWSKMSILETEMTGAISVGKSDYDYD